MIYLTFDAYMATRSTTYTHEIVSMRETWHARDAEIADLQRQLRERDAAIVQFKSERGFHAEPHKFCCDNGRCLWCEESYVRAEAKLDAVPNQAALDAYVQERVDMAAAKEREKVRRLITLIVETEKPNGPSITYLNVISSQLAQWDRNDRL